jgi:microcystin-dependent protein
MSLQTIPLNLPLTLEASVNYTFEIVGETGDIGFDINTNNPYWSGSAGSSTGTVNSGTTDLRFSLIVNAIRSFALSVDNSMVKMDVPKVVTTGRFYDKTGKVMPVGSIMAYAGDTPPEGWLWCDGRDISRLVYRDLFARLGIRWGLGDGSTTFRLPDSRGFFLRGYAGGSPTDPDRNSRVYFNGTVVGDVVGSYQWCAVQWHTHNYWDVFHSERWGTASTVQVPGSFGSHSSDDDNIGSQMSRTTDGAGVNETRPVNMSVLYIIKY